MAYTNSDFELITEIEGRSPNVIKGVEDLWRENQLLSDAEIPERLKEVTTICLCSGTVVGVATTKLVQYKLFDNNFLYEFRCFISPEFRRPGLDTLMIVRTKELLETERLAHNIVPIGMVVVVENEALKKWTAAVWRGADMYFAGVTSAGHHIRVGYFKRAVLQPIA